MHTDQLLSLLIYECNSDMLFGVAYTVFDVLRYLGALWIFLVLFTVAMAMFPFIISLTLLPLSLSVLLVPFIFSLFPFPSPLFFSLLCPSLPHSVTVSPGFSLIHPTVLYLCSASFLILNLSSPSFCPSVYFCLYLSFCSSSFLSTLSCVYRQSELSECLCLFV